MIADFFCSGEYVKSIHSTPLVKDFVLLEMGVPVSFFTLHFLLEVNSIFIASLGVLSMMS